MVNRIVHTPEGQREATNEEEAIFTEDEELSAIELEIKDLKRRVFDLENV